MKKIILLRLLKFLALAAPVAALVLYVQTYWFCFVDSSTHRVSDFYLEDSNTMDVVFVGASEIFTGYAPGYAYEKYGFTSYPYAIDANPGSLFKYEMREILKHQSPGLIFIEVEGFLYEDDEHIWDEARLRIFTENIPMSLNKLQAIMDFQYEDKLSCLVPFIKYHGDWTNPEATGDRRYNKTHGYTDRSLLKNICTYSRVDSGQPMYDIRGDHTAAELAPQTQEILFDFLAFLKEEQLDNVVFIRFPHKIYDETGYSRHCRANAVAQIVQQAGYPFINLEHLVDDIGIDYARDFYEGDHLNVYGQVKLTDYLGSLIVGELGLVPVQQTQANREHWEMCAEYTDAFFTLVDRAIVSGTDAFYPDAFWILDHLRIVMSETAAKTPQE